MAQVVQHNIMALNSYNKLSTNNSALSKNLEKLSSGYKINRAGDDAAGLAISEKMRAQITGLERAADNAQDGISLVQTAEGALTEVHSMLNRMVELATQAANGTYDNDVDRANLQKEVDSLLEEIDRISDETNFNGIKLLDGSMGASGSTTALTEASETVAPTAVPVESEAVAAEYTIELTKAFVANDTFSMKIGDKTVTATAASGGTIDSDKTKEEQAEQLAKWLGSDSAFGSDAYDIKVDGNKITLTAKTAGADANRNSIKFADTTGYNIRVTESTQGVDENTTADDSTHAQYKITLGDVIANGKKITIAGIDLQADDNGGTGKITSGATATTATQAKEIADILKNHADLKDKYHVDCKNNEITITAKASGIDPNAATMSQELSGDITSETKFSVTAGDYSSSVKAADARADAVKAKYTFTIDSKFAANDTFTINGKTITAASGGAVANSAIDSDKTAEEQAKQLAEIFCLDKNFDNYRVSVDGTTVTIEALTEGIDANAANMKVTGTNKDKLIVETTAGSGKVDATEGTKAQYVIDLDTAFKANDTVTVGDKVFTFKTTANVSKDTDIDASKTIKEQAIDIKDKLLDDDDFRAKYDVSIDAGNKIHIIAKEVGAEGNMTVEVNDAAKKASVTNVREGTDPAEDYGDTSFEVNLKGASYQSTLGSKVNVNGKTYEFVKQGGEVTTEGAIAVEIKEKATDADIANALADKIYNSDLDVKVGIDKTDAAKLVITKNNTADEDENLEVTIEGQGLGLQIGDTASQRITVAVADMGTKALGIDKIDITSEQSASEAIDVIKNAINKVSVTRAGLGAIQNRLEHTITNLETTTENLTNSESRIRDTDMAKEMMAYTQNNVLSQAAQAMLAQANQQPQQVLQLLQ